MMSAASLFALALAAQAALATEPYRAQGSDPSWSLTIGNGRMTYTSPGRPDVSVALPAASSGEGPTMYQTPSLSVTIYPHACTDKATGRRYTDSVMVEAKAESSIGCGGAVLPADSLNGTSWHFAEIAGESTGLTGDLLRDDRYAVDFYADGLKGYGGCNMFRAGYSQAEDVLTVKLEGSTTGVCREPVMGRERRLLQILSEPVRISFPDADTLVLTGEKGAIRLVRTKEEN